MSKLPAIELGTFGPGPREGKPFKIDLDLLMEQNLLLQANSGGGKSWALRRLIEQAYGKLPIVVIDPEGEFSTLRQKFDFLIVGRGGETPAAVQTAPLLARRILELRVSAVCDLFELRPVERARWFAAFVEALVEAPKDLWGDLMVAVDEAHEFAPQGGHGRVRGDSGGVLAASNSAFAALASKGRKRGQLTVAATQRLGKFDKDVAAELKNVLVGLTWIDVDRERAAESLGIGKENKAHFYDRIKQMPAGHFYGLGRALGLLEPTPVCSGDIETEHPKRGRRQSAPPPPTAKIKHLLPQLSDLPREAEENLKTEAGLRAEVSRLKIALQSEVSRQPGKVAEPRVVEVLPATVLEHLEQVDSLARDAAQQGETLRQLVRQVSEAGAAALKVGKRVHARAPGTPTTTNGTAAAAPAQAFVARRVVIAPPDGYLTKAARALLAAIAQAGGSATDAQISILSAYSVTSSSFKNALSELRTAGLIEGGTDARVLTDEGRNRTADVPPAPTGKALVDWWLAKLGKCERALLSTLWAAGGRLSFEDLAEKSTYSPTSSSFKNALSTLRSGRLATGGRGEDIELAPTFMET
jgi:uncharacterized protein